MHELVMGEMGRLRTENTITIIRDVFFYKREAGATKKRTTFKDLLENTIKISYLFL